MAKEFKLTSWPELPAAYNRMPYRRLLNGMSQRFACAASLAEVSGLSRFEVRQFLDLLAAHGLLEERERLGRDSRLGGLGPLGGWLRRALNAQP